VAGAKPCSTKSIYPRLAQYEGVALASPVLEIEAAIPARRDR
jgi:putative ABC transport system permease protein